MALRNSLAFTQVLLVLSASASGMRNTHSTLHWLRFLDPAAECASTASPPLAIGALVTDPKDCMNFYMCDGVGGYIGPLRCEDWMKCFDAVTDSTKPVCSADIGICNGICTAIGPQCTTVCPGTVGAQVYDPIDCSKHYVCVGVNGDELFEAHCSEVDLPYFNGRECVANKNQCCNCRTPTCINEGEVLPDPQDCHSYYACVKLGGVLTPVHGTCMDEAPFVGGQCDPDTDYCDNVCVLDAA